MDRNLQHFVSGFLKRAKEQFDFLESHPGQVRALERDMQTMRPNFDWMGPFNAENWAPKNHLVGTGALNGMLSKLIPEHFIWPGNEFIRRNGVYDALNVQHQSKQYPMVWDWGKSAVPKLKILSHAY